MKTYSIIASKPSPRYSGNVYYSSYLAKFFKWSDYAIWLSDSSY